MCVCERESEWGKERDRDFLGRESKRERERLGGKSKRERIRAIGK